MTTYPMVSGCEADSTRPASGKWLTLRWTFGFCYHQVY